MERSGVSCTPVSARLRPPDGPWRDFWYWCDECSTRGFVTMHYTASERAVHTTACDYHSRVCLSPLDHIRLFRDANREPIHTSALHRPLWIRQILRPKRLQLK